MSTTIQQTADRVRGISLRELLRWHGFEVRQEGIGFRAQSDQYNIVVTGNKWFDNKAGVGGAGAIDLQMHLCGRDFQTTCRVLAEGFPTTGTGLVFPPSKDPVSLRRAFEELAAKYAVPSTMNWTAAHDYLVGTRKTEAAIVDELHDRGSIYANNHQPNPGIVFLHRTAHGKVAGATPRDTRHETSFHPTLGDKVTEWFTVGDPIDAGTVVAMESPIDALCYYTLFPGRNGSLAVTSCSGSMVPSSLHMPHLRVSLARWRAAHAPTTNQHIRRDDSRPGRPLIQGVRFASVPASIDGPTRVRRAAISCPMLVSGALIGSHRSGSTRLRPLASLSFTEASNQRSITDSLGSVRPIVPSSLVPMARLRVQRIGGMIPFDLSRGVLGNGFQDSSNDLARQTGPFNLRGRFPGSNDRQDCTFPRKSAEAGRWRSIPRLSCACQARFGGSHLFQTHSQTAPTKHMAHKHNTKTARIDLDITVESQQRFAAIHKALGFKTRAETFEAIMFSVTAKDVIHPNVMERIETKLDQTLEIIESLT